MINVIKMKYCVEKFLDGYTVCFRQWQAKHSHCHYLHGYALSFKLYFQSEMLDAHNWVWDFGWLKHSAYKIDHKQPAEWFKYMFDHTVLVAPDDPALAQFEKMAEQDIIQLRIIDDLSCEKIAELILNKVGDLVKRASNQRTVLTRVDVYENNKNCAACIND
jgi:6-pyruvoyltetrahydropterin/6-carboxytetrahydropterin synthase